LAKNYEPIKIHLLTLVTLFTVAANAQVTVALINSADIAYYLQGNGISINNLVINCDSQAYGKITAGVSSFPMGEGMILSTDKINEIPNPASYFASFDFLNSSDGIDIYNSVFQQTHDGCALEFDAIPAFNNIYFEYTWASEEYPEYVCSYNDAFLLLVSGPGINGNYSNNALNIAILPDNSSIVSINTVHENVQSSGTNSPCYITFDSLYIDNIDDTSIVFDGYTQMLTAGINLNPGDTYHFKIVLADVMDNVYDSGVFLL
jgi:hypothetical protein